MRRLRAWVWRVAGLFNGARSDRDLADEIEAHLRMHADDHERAGLSPEEARRQAVLAFGGLQQVTEQYRDRRSVPIVAATLQDVRYALRSFRKSPGFTAAVLIVLALGIGANAAIFTVVNAVLLKPLPYKDADRLVMVWHVPPPAMFPGRTQFAVSAANYLDWERRQHVFDRMAIHGYKTYTLTGRGQAELLRAQSVSAGFFDVLGVRPIEGRWFLPGEDEPGREPVVILSHRLWQTRFGGDRAVVGSRVNLDGSPFTVVGIMGPAFTFPDWAQLWTPLVWTEKERAVRSEHSLMVIARLAPGVDVQRGTGRDGRDLANPRTGVPGRQQGVGRGRSADARRPRRRGADVAARAGGRGGARAAHRVRERREPRVRPHPCEKARNGRPPGAGRRRGTDRAAGPD